MTLTSMKEATGPLDELILSRHEDSWGFRLPDDYRRFLLQFNGGRPHPRYFEFKDHEGGSSVHSFLGFNEDYNRNLVKKLQMFKDRLPARFFPVAYDDGGNQICLSISGNDRGKVYFWDHELQADQTVGESPENADNIMLVADSFEEFLNGLHESA